MIYIYNKRTGKITSSSIDGQYFGKNHLNTITYPDGTKGYWVEKAFADMEGTITPALNKITSTKLNNSKDISYDDKLHLSMFVSAQFWRLPINDQLVDEMIDTGDLGVLNSYATDTRTGKRLSKEKEKELYNNMARTDMFKKVYPLLIALSSLAKKDAFTELSDWHFYFQDPGFNLTSDNPILYVNQPNKDTIFKDFVMTLSPGVMLISRKNPPNELTSQISNMLNILQVCHANQFVASQNKDFLKTITDIYEESFADKKLPEVGQFVFNDMFSTSK